jgi:hypothetical protein
MKTLVIGDIHGCYVELLELLDQAGLADDDRIIALGDIVDRGPDSSAVLDFFRSHPNALSIMGSHERKHIRASLGEIEPSIAQTLTRQQFSEQAYSEAVTFMKEFPMYVEIPEAILFHGLLEPGISLEEQRETVLVGSMSGEHHMKRHYNCAWYELYSGEKPIIAGHHDYSKVGKPTVYRDRVFLIDTGCCFGGNLTALHRWKEWEYASPDSCEMTRFCQKYGIEDHEWSMPEAGTFSQRQVCLRCEEQDNPRSEFIENLDNDCKSCGCPGGPDEHSMTYGEVQRYL